MREVYVGSAPSEEPCAQVGEPGFRRKAEAECEAYRQQLIRMFPQVKGAAVLVAKAQHSFGTYLYVMVIVRDDDKEALEYAFRVERNAPAKWDAKAIKYLQANGAI